MIYTHLVLFSHKSKLTRTIAGAREVFGLCLAYAIYYICRHPAAQEKLRHELAAVPSSAEGVGGFPAPAAMEELPYLTAVIQESLRMRPNSTPLPRETPPGKTVSICGVDGIPPGTRVNCFQWFLHRDETQWDRPHEWDPERWLDCDTEKLGPYWAFASGPRMCVGTNLTYYCKFSLVLATNWGSKKRTKTGEKTSHLFSILLRATSANRDGFYPPSVPLHPGNHILKLLRPCGEARGVWETHTWISGRSIVCTV